MDYFNYKDGRLWAENVDISANVENWGTPCYVYSRATIERHWKAFDSALGKRPHLVCYAVKANSNLAVLNVLAKLGSGFDIVSMGELERVLRAGGSASKIVFSGVGKTAEEMARALDVGIRCFNVESQAELRLLEQVAADKGVLAPVSLRVNPDVDAKTHPYISTGLKDNKFGIAIEDALQVYQSIADSSHLTVEGVDCHIGSQLTDVSPFVDALDRVLALVDRLAENNIKLKHLDLGGGLGIRYRDETPPLPEEQMAAVLQRLGDRKVEILIEPGRAIVGNAGLLLTRVQYLKHNEEKNFCVVDAAMNDLMRPALYGAWHEIEPVLQSSSGQTSGETPGEKQAKENAPAKVYDVVGPICETGDFIGKDRALSIEQGELLFVRSAGAYGFTMSSNYNSRPRVAEIMVDGDKYQVVRQRETIEQLFANESVLDS
jgi:diaminopimelate decarboxylase